MPSYDTPPRVSDLLKNLVREQRRMAANRRLENATIGQGGITITDPEGNVVGKIGELDDGTTGISGTSQVGTSLTLASLDTRIVAVDAKADQAKSAALDAQATADTNKADLESTDAVVATKADQTYVDDYKTTTDAVIADLQSRIEALEAYNTTNP